MLFRSSAILLLLLGILLPSFCFGQYNSSVRAEILSTENTEFTELKANARNLTELNRDLTYVFSVIRSSDGQTDAKTDKTEEGFSLAPFETEVLSEITINKSETAKIIVLFLIYNYEKELIGKARWALNEIKGNEPATISKDQLKSYSDPILSGIVTEDTRTKPGRDFYKLFYSDYFLSQLNAEEIISVREVLALGRNTIIEVKIGSTMVSRFFLQPKEDYLKKMVKVTMANISRYLQTQKTISKEIERY
jgi:hypothetical protein